jgi:hypothetical protein
MALICREIEERIEEEVWEPVEKWVKKREKKCKKKKCKKWCLCCNKWLCWIETFLEKVITRIVKTVINIFVRVVCEIIHDIVEFVIDVITSLGSIIWDILNILWNIITWDWADVKKWWKELLADLADLGTTILDAIKIIVRIFTGGYIAEYIREKINNKRLKDYVRKLLEKEYGDNPELLDSIKEKINLDFGPFGLEFRATSFRSFVDSRTTEEDQQANLLKLHESGIINLYELSGITPSSILDRPEVEASLISGGSLSKEDVDDYIKSKGKSPHFRIYAISKSAEKEKLNVAADKARQIGLKFKWTRDVKEIKGYEDIDVGRNRLTEFLQNVIQRDPKGTDVCNLAAAAVFTISPVDGRRPFGWTKTYSEKNPISGLIHRDRKPTAFFKYVLIHECGHYFSLQHPNHDGLDKIMYSPAENEWWSANLIFEFLWWSGEPRFTLDDGKRTWDFIIKEITQCLIR